jgi:phosphate transport system substrate-binding protein
MRSNRRDLTTRRTTLLAALLCGLALACAGCGKKQARAETAAAPAEITGAGATFPYPLYAKWGAAHQQVGGVKLNYQSIGSGGGIQQIKARTVDFGASDAPLDPKDLDAAGLLQFPMVIGGVVPVVHLEGLASGALVLDGPSLAAIFLGEIQRWDDQRIRTLNPGTSLPPKDITVAHRADGSGTTWIFTSYLAKSSAAWKQRVGADKAVSWPVGVGGKGNEGVSVYVQRVDGAIGYVEHAYAVQNKLAVVRMKNAAGKVVEPGIRTFQAAAVSADWTSTPGFAVVLIDQPGDAAWPIVGASFILLHREQPDAAKARAMLELFEFGLRKGAAMAEALDYVPMPLEVVDLVERAWAAHLRAGGRSVWPPAGRPAR